MAVNRRIWGSGILIAGLLAFGLGCGEAGEGGILMVDAEFDPVMASDHNLGINEARPGVAQSFTVLADGKFEQFWIVLTDGESVDTGTVRVTVRPVVGGLPDPSPAASIIDPIDVATSTLPSVLVEEFTAFDVGNDPGREVMTGEVYAIVVEFVSRDTSTDTLPIARILGIATNPYADGTGAEDNTAGYVANTNDYLFRTFVLQ